MMEFFEYLLRPLPGDVQSATLRPPFGPQSVRAMMERMVRWCDRADRHAHRQTMLLALVSPRGTHILHEAMNGCETAEMVATVLLPLARLLLREPFREGLAAHPITARAHPMLFQHALWTHAALRLRLLCTHLRHMCVAGAMDQARVEAELLPLTEAAVLGLSGSTTAVAGPSHLEDLEGWLRTLDLIQALIAHTSLPDRLDVVRAELAYRIGVLQRGGFDRHDNDHADFRDITLLPSAQELLCPHAPHLPRANAPELLNEMAPGAELNVDALEPSSEASQAWLARCFRLLREDLVAPLREEIRLLRDYWQPDGAPSKHKAAKIAAAQRQRLLRRTFDEVAFRSVETVGSATWYFRVRFKQPTPLLQHAGTAEESVISAAKREEYWRDHAALMSRGALVCFIRSNGEPLRFGVVVYRNESWLANRQPPANPNADDADGEAGSGPGYDPNDPTAAFIGVRISGEDATMDSLRELRNTGHGQLRMVAVDASYFAYAPVLRRLQRMHTIPFPELLFSNCAGVGAFSAGDTLTCKLEELGQLVAAGADLRPLLQCPMDNTSPVHLDEHQLQAVRACLTSRCPLVQGPPGTGWAHKHTRMQLETTATRAQHWLNGSDLTRALICACVVVRLCALSGKTLVGAVVTRLLLLYTDLTVIAVTFTNHALDDLLIKLQRVGVHTNDMVRISSNKKIHSSLQSISLNTLARQPEYRKFLPGPEFARKKDLSELVNQVRRAVPRALAQWHRADGWRGYNLVKSMWMQDPSRRDEQSVWRTSFETADAWHTVGSDGHALTPHSAWKLWCEGAARPKGLAEGQASLWDLAPADRQRLIDQLTEAPRQRALQDLHDLLQQLDQQQELREEYTERPQQLQVLHSRRVIACTSTSAATHRDLLDALRKPHVILAEECCELLEPHLLAACNSDTRAVIQIGDHKQLRPRVNVVSLQRQSGAGLDLNVSLMERMIGAGFPVKALCVQHRMHPEVASLVRGLELYAQLEDAPHVATHPPIRGLRERIVFFETSTPEDAGQWQAATASPGNAAASAAPAASGLQSVSVQQVSLDSVSKTNVGEARLVAYVVEYLLKQGYRKSSITVLAPYLGQVRMLRDELGQRLHGQAGGAWQDAKLLAHAAGEDASVTANSGGDLCQEDERVDVRSIDNYQGEENDIIVVSLVRSNTRRDIGFLREAERVNVMLSRARHGLILLGDLQDTLCDGKGQPCLSSKRTLWSAIYRMLDDKGQLFDGLPTRCAQHGKAMDLRLASDFARCTGGGCDQVCGAPMQCGKLNHACARMCHPPTAELNGLKPGGSSQASDGCHSAQQCSVAESMLCAKHLHTLEFKCAAGPPKSCSQCDKLERKRQEKERRDAEHLLAMQKELAWLQQTHEADMAALKLQADVDLAQQLVKQQQQHAAAEAATLKQQLEKHAAAALAKQQQDAAAHMVHLQAQITQLTTSLPQKKLPPPAVHAPASSSSSKLLEPVARDSDQFKHVELMFLKSLAGMPDYATLQFKVKAVERVNNPALSKQFEHAQAALQAAGDPSEVVSAWHGTGPSNIDSIARSNLSMSKKGQLDAGWFGAGLYFSEMADYTFVYAPFRTRIQAGQSVRIMQFDLLPGKVHECKAHSSESGKAPAAGFHSNRSPTHFERVLFDSRHCVPRFVVEVEAHKAHGHKFNASPEKNGPGSGFQAGMGLGLGAY